MSDLPVPAVEVSRTFTPFQESASDDPDFEFWLRHRDGRGVSWNELTDKRLVVVVGEAGIGKTYEFLNQARRLQSAGKAAFFIQLNQLASPDDWLPALGKQTSLFEHWKSGTDPGYFFLDAVDEARLTGPIALRRALDCVQRGLAGTSARVSLFVSSRVSDWNLSAVRTLIEEKLVPQVSARKSSRMANFRASTAQDTSSGDTVPLAVYCLDPLSVAAAKVLARHYGVRAISMFWAAVQDGAYEFLASRPLDLEWMTSLWNSSGRLGSFLELLETAVTNRLREKNPGYVEAGAVLSPGQLRSGVEALAAASVFSDNAYFQVEAGVDTAGVIVFGDSLPDWKPHEIQRLLGSAVFDEATYGRVQFHHRAIREYLAAWWVKRRLDTGLPFREAWVLFTRTLYGEEFLLSSRRPVLCWLAALDARVRTRVIQAFPEMVIFEGDPQQWSVDDVVEAFSGYLERVRSGFRADWHNDASEFRRVARMIPPAQLSTWINAYRNDLVVLFKLLTVVKHGRVSFCADQVFALYREEQSAPRLLGYSLDALSAVATDDQRAQISEDLLAGRLVGNAGIAAGIRVVGLAHLSSDRLVKCLAQTEPESGYGGGDMALAVKSDLLPDATLHEAKMLLAALVSLLPNLDARVLVRLADTDDHRDGWMFSVLPDVLLRCLNLSSTCDKDTVALLSGAALVVEKLRDTLYVNEQDVQELRTAVARFPDLRREVALEIARSDIDHANLKLLWSPGIVHLNLEDLDWLVRAANDTSTDSSERHVWYCVAREIAFMRLRGRARSKVLNELASGTNAEQWRAEICRIRLDLIEGARIRRGWLTRTRATSARELNESESNKAVLMKGIAGIRDGSVYHLIEWLVRRAAEKSETNRYTKVNVDAIHREFGYPIGSAFDSGLARAWRLIEVPDSTTYVDNSVPWRGIVGLASVNHAFRSGLRITSLSRDEVARIVRFCVWEPDRLDPWFTELAEKRPEEVSSALAPWFDFELALANDTPFRRTITLVLAGPPVLQTALLPRAIALIREGAVANDERRRTLVSAIANALPAGPELMAEIAGEALVIGFSASPPHFETGWFREWASLDFAAAWNWLMAHCDNCSLPKSQFVEKIADVMERNSPVWSRLAGDPPQVAALVELFQVVDEYLRSSEEHKAHQESGLRRSPARELSNLIPGMLSSFSGESAYRALISLAQVCRDLGHASWIRAQAYQQAAREADDAARISASALPSIGEPHTREAHTEAELFVQVMARLSEIADGVEKGPFSERGLFLADIPEKQLQLWLAARLEDTPRRSITARFVVTREPTVDADKRTDIEVSSKAGKVCIEIKPVSRKEGYAARSLVEDTLGRQLAVQYLRGRNSRHGILVLFRLDSKVWQIPGRQGNQPFGELVAYLGEEARRIAASDDHIQQLAVLAIDCTTPS